MRPFALAFGAGHAGHQAGTFVAAPRAPKTAPGRNGAITQMMTCCIQQLLRIDRSHGSWCVNESFGRRAADTREAQMSYGSGKNFSTMKARRMTNGTTENASARGAP